MTTCEYSLYGGASETVVNRNTELLKFVYKQITFPISDCKYTKNSKLPPFKPYIFVNFAKYRPLTRRFIQPINALKD